MQSRVQLRIMQVHMLMTVITHDMHRSGTPTGCSEHPQLQSHTPATAEHAHQRHVTQTWTHKPVRSTDQILACADRTVAISAASTSTLAMRRCVAAAVASPSAPPPALSPFSRRIVDSDSAKRCLRGRGGVRYTGEVVLL